MGGKQTSGLPVRVVSSHLPHGGDAPMLLVRRKPDKKMPWETGKPQREGWEENRRQACL